MTNSLSRPKPYTEEEIERCFHLRQTSDVEIERANYMNLAGHVGRLVDIGQVNWQQDVELPIEETAIASALDS